MASKVTGSPYAQRQSIEANFDPQYGNQVVETWCGTKIAIYSLADGFRVTGAKVRFRNNGPLYTLTATFSNTATRDGTVELPVDKWEIVTEWAQVDLRANPKLQLICEQDPGAGTGIDKLTKYYALAKEALKTPDQIKLSALNIAPLGQQAVYHLLSQGVESYEIKRLVLRRVRTTSPQYHAPIVLNAVEQIYTTAALISEPPTGVGVPGPITKQLPPNPTLTPKFCDWGWKEREQSSQFVLSLNKIEEQSDWVFAAWPFTLFDFIRA